jgi:putative membrane protein
MWSNYGYQPGMMGHDGGWFWWMGLHGLLSLAIVAAIVIGIVAAVRYMSRHDSRFAPGTAEAGRQSALGILDSRYARGEIDRDDYLQRKKDLA